MVSDCIVANLLLKVPVKEFRQEAQLPLRNRASVTYFFVVQLLSIAVMTWSYVCQLQSLRLMIRLIYDAHTFHHATAARDSNRRLLQKCAC